MIGWLWWRATPPSSPSRSYAANYLGAIIVPVNFRLAAGEVAYIIGNCEPAVVIADADRMPTVHDALAERGDAVPVVDLAVLAAPTVESTIP